MIARMAAPLRNLDASYYVDAGIFETERQSIFRRHWPMLGPVSRVAKPGDYLAVDVAGWKLFALRGRDGLLRAFHNVCRHRGSRLYEEDGRSSQLNCPYHAWGYRLDGSLRSHEQQQEPESL